MESFSRQKVFFFFFGSLLSTIFFASCGEDAPKAPEKNIRSEDATEPDQCEKPVVQAKVDFLTEVEPILQENCTSCHATQAPIFSTVEDSTANVDAIVDSANAGRMPPGKKLSDADLSILVKWGEGTKSAQLSSFGLVDESYEGLIKGIVDSKCATCHSAAAVRKQTPYLTTYSEVKTNVDAMLVRMKTRGARKMPPNGSTPLAATDIATLTAWQTAGFPEKAAPTTPPPNTIFYVDAIKNALATNCISCHGAGLTSPDLSTYSKVVAEGDAINEQVQGGTMPTAGALPAEAKALFASWTAAKFPYAADPATTPPVSSDRSGNQDATPAPVATPAATPTPSATPAAEDPCLR